MKQEALTLEERQKLRKQLAKGDMKRIAKVAGVTVYTVYRYFKGQNDSPVVMEHTINLLERRKKSFKKAKSFVQNL